MTLWRPWRVCRVVCWWEPARLTFCLDVVGLIHKVMLNKIITWQGYEGWDGKMLGFCYGPLHFPSRFFQIHHCQPLQFMALSCVTEVKNPSCYHEASNAALVCDFPPNRVTSLTSFCNFASASGIIRPLLCIKGCHCGQPILIRVLEKDWRYT